MMGNNQRLIHIQAMFFLIDLQFLKNRLKREFFAVGLLKHQETFSLCNIFVNMVDRKTSFPLVFKKVFEFKGVGVFKIYCDF